MKFHRLHLIANNARFLILPQWHLPNLASRVLALNLQRLSQDWERYYGHPILLVETFVDASRFRGTCYRAAGWQMLGARAVSPSTAGVISLMASPSRCGFVRCARTPARV